MKFINKSKTKWKKFINESQHTKNLECQLKETAAILKRLNFSGITPQTKLRIDFTFLTNKEKKTSYLKSALEFKKYVTHPPQKNNKEWELTGRTPEIKMDIKTIKNWVYTMCTIGFEHDCEFKGWRPDSERSEKHVTIKKDLTDTDYFNLGLDYYHHKDFQQPKPISAK